MQMRIKGCEQPQNTRKVEERGETFVAVAQKRGLSVFIHESAERGLFLSKYVCKSVRLRKNQYGSRQNVSSLGRAPRSATLPVRGSSASRQLPGGFEWRGQSRSTRAKANSC